MKEKAKKKIRWILGIICCISLVGNMVCFQYINRFNSELKSQEEEITPIIELYLYSGGVYTRQELPFQNTIIEAEEHSCVYEMDKDSSAWFFYESISEGEEKVDLSYCLKRNGDVYHVPPVYIKKGYCLDIPLDGEGEYLIHANYNGMDKYISFQLTEK